MDELKMILIVEVMLKFSFSTASPAVTICQALGQNPAWCLHSMLGVQYPLNPTLHRIHIRSPSVNVSPLSVLRFVSQNGVDSVADNDTHIHNGKKNVSVTRYLSLTIIVLKLSS